MGIFFRVFTSIAGYGSLLLCALALTAGLYMLAEFAEEYPSFTGRVMKGLVIGVVAVYVILAVDGMPLKESLIGIVSHLTYYTMLSKFPFLEFFSLKSVASLAAIVSSHYFWFAFFIDHQHDFAMHQILGFFIVMVWAVPCGLLISLTINENVLPSSRPTDLSNDGQGSKKRATVYVAAVNFCTGFFRNISEAILPPKGKSFIGGSKFGGKKSY
jgi:Transmembrane adaptor Erv26